MGRGRHAAVGTALTVLGTLAGCATAAPEIAVRDATVRVPANPDVTAGYLTLENTGGTDDTLTGVTSEAAAEVQMHDTTDSGGETRMRQRDEVAVPAGDTVVFETGGLHLMLMGPDDLRAGDTVELSLEFATSDRVSVDAVVEEIG
ncbi:copper chaperone PCu(A)C [Halostreptopolyspora alba]|uniref:Copper chaperone PCu(A)C n=1 Tax=Halostreptopolyspora alba TaxID=2487137 RepID=A0A3N0E1S1_9ACTN|nr:copper chaperone PCu(A)C [Nocardiopsaceae bacterium YIM 96095]